MLVLPLRTVKREGTDGGLSSLVADAAEGVKILSLRPTVDADRIALVGHGQGGLVALVVAGGKLAPVLAVAALGAPARPLIPWLEARLRARLLAASVTPAEIETQIARLAAEMEGLKSRDRTELSFDEQVLADLAAVDPARAYIDVRIPVLALFGERDVEVPSAHRAFLRSALALGKTTAYRFQVLTGADHDFLQVSPSSSPESLLDSQTDVARSLHPALVVFVRDFLREVPIVVR